MIMPLQVDDVRFANKIAGIRSLHSGGGNRDDSQARLVKLTAVFLTRRKIIATNFIKKLFSKLDSVGNVQDHASWRQVRFRGRFVAESGINPNRQSFGAY
jgi:hypothetical protein